MGNEGVYHIQNTGKYDYLKQLLEFIHNARGIDFSLYRQATVSRKLDLRMQETGCTDHRSYYEYLRNNPDELQALVRTLTIKVSNFFRNPLVFELLHTVVLPEIISGFRFLKAWSIGCANGEEPYSVAMLVREIQTQERLSFPCSILGTDVDPDAVERAKKGEYSGEELFETKRKFVEGYFSEQPYKNIQGHGRFRINEEIRSMVRFSSANIMDLLLSGKPGLGTHNLILCRNVLIYMNRDMQEELFRSLKEIIYDQGYLVIGESETMSENIRKDFEQPFPGIKIFRKLRSAAAG